MIRYKNQILKTCRFVFLRFQDSVPGLVMALVKNEVALHIGADSEREAGASSFMGPGTTGAAQDCQGWPWHQVPSQPYHHSKEQRSWRHQGSLSPRCWVPPWETGWAKASSGHGPAGGPGLVGPMPRQDKSIGVLQTGPADGPGTGKWSWANNNMGKAPWGGQRQSGLVVLAGLGHIHRVSYHRIIKS